MTARIDVTKVYVARRLTRTEWTPTDSSYQEDSGWHLVPPDDLEGLRERIRIQDLPIVVQHDDEVRVVSGPAFFSAEIISRVVTERRPP